MEASTDNVTKKSKPLKPRISKNKVKLPRVDAQAEFSNKILVNTPNNGAKRQSLSIVHVKFGGNRDNSNEQSSKNSTRKSKRKAKVIEPLRLPIMNLKIPLPQKPNPQRKMNRFLSVFFRGDNRIEASKSSDQGNDVLNDEKEYASSTSLLSFLKTLAYLLCFYFLAGPLATCFMMIRRTTRHLCYNLQFVNFSFTCFLHHYLWLLALVCSAGVWVFKFEVINLTDNYTMALAGILLSYIQASRYGAMSSGMFASLRVDSSRGGELSKDGVFGSWRQQVDSVVYTQVHYAARRNVIDNALFKLKSFKRLPEALQKSMHSHYHEFVDFMVRNRYQDKSDEQEMEMIGIDNLDEVLSPLAETYWGCTIKGVSAYLFLLFKYKAESKHIGLYCLAFLTAFLRSLLPSKIILTSITKVSLRQTGPLRLNV